MENNDNEIPSFNSIDEYKEYFEPIFRIDCKFSQQFMPLANQILLKNIATIYNHERHETPQDKENDLRGRDRTIVFPKLPCGIRVRRDKPKYLSEGDFTIDTKEWQINLDDKYYVYGYGIENPIKFRLWVLIDYQGLRKAEKAGKICGKLMSNRDHSFVDFWCFKLSEMFKLGLILDWNGEKELIEQILGKDALKPRNVQLTSFV